MIHCEALILLPESKKPSIGSVYGVKSLDNQSQNAYPLEKNQWEKSWQCPKVQVVHFIVYSNSLAG